MLLGVANHHIGRPLLLEHLLVRPGEEGIAVGPFRAAAAVGAVLLIDGLAPVCVVDLHIVVVGLPVLLLAAELLDGSSVLDLAVDGLRGTAESFRNLAVRVLFLLQDGDLAALGVGKVFSLAGICAKMGLRHVNSPLSIEC